MLRMILILVLLGSPAWATWGLVQHKNKTTCSGSSCAVTVTSTGSGHAIFVVVLPDTSSVTTISSVSGGGTYTHCSNCAVAISAGLAIDISFTCSSTSGATTVTANLSQSGGGGYVMEVIEYSYTNGCSLDTSGSRTALVALSNPPGVSLTLTGTNDVIVQGVNFTTSATAVSSPYSNPADFPGGDGVAGAINTASGTAPTWTATLGTGAFAALALKENAGTSCAGAPLAGMGAGPC